MFHSTRVQGAPAERNVDCYADTAIRVHVEYKLFSNNSQNNRIRCRSVKTRYTMKNVKPHLVERANTAVALDVTDDNAAISFDPYR